MLIRTVPEIKLSHVIGSLRLFFIKTKFRVLEFIENIRRKTTQNPTPETVGQEVTKALLADVVTQRTLYYNARLRQPESIVPEVYSSVLGELAMGDNYSIGYLSFYGKRVVNHHVILGFNENIRTTNELTSAQQEYIYNKVKDLDAHYKTSDTETVTLIRTNNEGLRIEYLVVQA